LNKDIFIFTTYEGFVKEKENADYVFRHGYRKSERKAVGFEKKHNVNIIENSKKKVNLLNNLKLRFKKVFTFLNVNNAEIDSEKQSLAFKANIIHHLDAMWIHSCLNKLSEIKEFSGICPIHDCFGVCFDDVSILNKVVRECLVEFFKQDNAYFLLYNLERSKHSIRHKLSEDDETKLNNILNSLNVDNINKSKIIEDLPYAYYMIFPG